MKSNYNNSVIHCKNGKASLTFEGNSMSNTMILIRNITFQYCGPGSHHHTPAALFFADNCSVELNHVVIEILMALACVLLM